MKLDFTKKKVAVLGGGSWATALAKIVMNNVESINWYMRKPEQTSAFAATGKNPHYLSAIKFDVSRIHFSNDINEVVANSDVLILAVPSPFLKLHLKKKLVFVLLILFLKQYFFYHLFEVGKQFQTLD